MSLYIELTPDQMYKFVGPDLQRVLEKFNKNLPENEYLKLKHDSVKNIKVLIAKEIWKKRSDNSLDIGTSATQIMEDKIKGFCQN